MGLTVMGFGLSSLFTAPLVATLVSSLGIFNMFIVLGVSFLFLLAAAGAALKFPPEEWSAPTKVEHTVSRQEVDFSISEMLRTPTFFLSGSLTS